MFLFRRRKAAALEPQPIPMPARTPSVHDYRSATLRWGRNIVVHRITDTGEACISGWGHGIQDGDHLLLDEDGCHGRYEITEIEHHRDPADMWGATIRPTPADG
ncbi:hypothetical protein [Streptomyces acidiscabies]|uniref:hypothetical protein n=1 Tax=Streptomyces acidiscabies TaxID=42234 RepID=UPI000953667B|nr:hypothetical protein [Streptomyces acidiscabies]